MSLVAVDPPQSATPNIMQIKSGLQQCPLRFPQATTDGRAGRSQVGIIEHGFVESIQIVRAITIGFGWKQLPDVGLVKYLR